MSNSTPLKRCHKCKNYLPATTQYFARSSSTKDSFTRRCKECARQYHVANRDNALAKMREYARQNAEVARARASRWQKDNAERYRARKKQHYEKNKSEILETQKQYRIDNHEAISIQGRQWKKRNPDAVRVMNQKRKSQKRGLPTTFQLKDWQRALDYFNGCCAVCGKPPGLFHTIAQDHWIPISSPECPGTTAMNIIPLCHTKVMEGGIGGCNQNKHSKMPEVWLEQQFGKRKAKQILERVNQYFEWVRAQDS